MARRASEVIQELPQTELVRPPDLSVVLFRRHGWSKPDYDTWSARLLSDQIGFVTPTVWEGETVARFAFLHPNTTEAMVREILDTMA
jgi:aromatic-L-amino-acid decarboxylase